MAELTIDASEITEALQRHVEDYEADGRDRADRPDRRGRRWDRPRLRVCPVRR